MAYTYDVSTTIGKIRLLINDHDEADVIFQDDELQAFLDINEDSLKYAAAQALDTIASNEAMVLKVITLMDLRTDGAATAKALREHAAQLREEADDADAAEEDGLFDYAEMVTDAFTARERIRKQALRGS